MPGYYAANLPAFRVPGPLDFSPLTEGLADIAKEREKNRLLAQRQAISSALLPESRTAAPGGTVPPSGSPGAQSVNRLLSFSPAQYGAKSVVDRIVGAESGGDPNATNPRSTAAGAGQFINSTWLSTIKSARPDLAAGKTDAELLAMRNDLDLSREMTGAYASQNSGVLSKAGFDATPGNQYLAHFAGPGGATAILRADPNTPVRAVLGDRVVQANPFLANMTAADLRAWADSKMGGGSPVPAPAQDVPAPAPASGMNYDNAIRVALQQGNLDEAMALQKAKTDAEAIAYNRSRQERQDSRQERSDAQTSELRGVQIQQGQEELQQTAALKIASISQAIRDQKDPARKAEMWGKFVSSSPRISDTLRQYGVDPADMEAGTAFLIAEARGASPAKPFTQEVQGRLVERQPDGSYKEVYAAPPKAKNLTVQEQKEVFEADEGVQAATNVIGALNRALKLNQQAYSGPFAQTRGYTTSMFGAEGGVATEELQNVVLQQVLDNLKATFGAAPTEGERQILVDIQGSVNKSPEVRKRIFENAIAAAERRRSFNETKAGAIRGGEYFQPGYQPSSPSTTQPAGDRSADRRPTVANGGDNQAGSPPAAAVQYLQSNPTPEIIAQFEAKYGAGTARRFLGQPGSTAAQPDPSAFGVSP